jgi:phosphatidylserine/phosphatidylglycerophosphate/cardiolipin synthase-like enzyme
MTRVIFQLFLAFSVLTAPLFAAFETPSATVYFSPDDQLALRLIELIEQETQSIHACIYTFTHKGIAKALIAAKNRGVEVELIVDRFSVKSRAPLQRLVQAGIPVYVWDPDPMRKTAHRPLMHHKFCVFGSEKVWTGSFNWSYEAANLHRENAVLMADKALAIAFQGQFLTVKLRSCIPYGAYIAVKRKH